MTMFLISVEIVKIKEFIILDIKNLFNCNSR